MIKLAALASSAALNGERETLNVERLWPAARLNAERRKLFFDMMEQILTYSMTAVDAFLIGAFRLTGHAMINFFIGSFWLAFWAVVAGELTLSLALRFNQKHLDELKDEILDREALSIQAYGVGDQVSYKALNKQANDAWGRHFFTMAAYSAGMLWPVPFALGWMDTRFHAVEFLLATPLSWIFGETVRYPFIFIPIYVLSRILFKYLRPWLPYFRGVQRMLAELGAGKGKR